MTLSSPLSTLRTYQTRLVALGLALGLTVLAHLGGEKVALLQAIEFSFRDSVQQLFAKTQHSSNIALIDIDEESLKRVGAWPWTRAQVADLAQAALRQGARLVVLDMVFPEPRDPQGDQRLLDLAKDRKVVLSQVFDYIERSPPNRTGTPAGSVSGITVAGAKQNTFAPIRAHGHIANHAGLMAAPCVGNIGFVPDEDGKVRRLILLTQWDDQVYPALSLAALACMPNSPLTKAQPKLDNTLLLRMTRTDESWATVPAHELFDPQGAISKLRVLDNKIVIIGSSALGLADRVATPLSSSTSGMLVHAHAIEQLTSSETETVLPGGAVLALGLILLILIAWLFTNLMSLRMVLVLTALIVTVWVAFIMHEALLGSEAFLTAPLTGLIALAAFHLPSELGRARREVRSTVNLLSRYVARPVLQELLKAGNFDPLRLRNAEITVVVVDMVDYSKTIAGLDLKTAGMVTRGFLECLTEPVWSTRGTLDRYTGDGLVAFWGAPLTEPHHARQALLAIRAMQHNIERFNESLLEQGLPELRIRIGIASGDALVGDFGTRYRATYTAVGSCINTAARLENKAKELQFSVLANEMFAQSIEFKGCTSIGTHDLRGIGSVAVYCVANT